MCVEVSAKERRAPVTLVVAEALLVTVVLARERMLPESVRVWEAVALVREYDRDPTAPVKEAVADEEVKAAERRPPEVMPWAAEVRDAVVCVVEPVAPVTVSSLLVVSQPNPEVSEAMALAPLKKAIWPEVPDPDTPPVHTVQVTR